MASVKANPKIAILKSSSFKLGFLAIDNKNDPKTLPIPIPAPANPNVASPAPINFISIYFFLVKTYFFRIKFYLFKILFMQTYNLFNIGNQMIKIIVFTRNDNNWHKTMVHTTNLTTLAIKNT